MHVGYVILQLCCGYVYGIYTMLFLMRNVSYFYIITFRSKCAVSNMAVFVVT